MESIDDKTHSLAEYGQWMKLHSYLFIGQERAALVDTGLGIAPIKQWVARLCGLPLTVLSTHAHWDHIGGHHQFADLWVHAAEKEWLEEGYESEMPHIREYLTERPFTKAPPEEFQLDRYRVPGCRPTKLIRDGDQIDLGGRILDFYHTPGHSPGHVCIHEKATGYLVTGDLLYQGTLLAGLSDSDPSAYLDSLSRMVQVPDLTRLLPGHGRLSIETTLLQEARDAFIELRDKGQLERGSGTHAATNLLINL